MMLVSGYLFWQLRAFWINCTHYGSVHYKPPFSLHTPVVDTAASGQADHDKKKELHGFVFPCMHVVLFLLIGSLSKPIRRRQRERHQIKGSMSKTIAAKLPLKSLYISFRPLQNNNVKWPSSVSSTELGRRWLILGISIFKLNGFRAVAYWTDLDNREIRW